MAAFKINIGSLSGLVCAGAFAASAAATELPPLENVKMGSTGGAWDAKPSSAVIIEERKLDAHTLYGDKESLEFLSGIIGALSSIAKQDVFLATPSSFLEMSPGEWMSHPFARKWIGYKNPESWKKNEPLIRENFHGLQTHLIATRKSQNFFALTGEKGAGCLIGGSINIDTPEIARQLGSIPHSLLTEDFGQTFDRKSILTMIFLHEATHCAQDAHETRNKTRKLEEDILEHLPFEIHADRTAEKRYRNLTGDGQDLDPEMPEKFKALRYLYLMFFNTELPAERSLDEDFYLGSLPYGHITAGATHTGTSYEGARKTLEMAVRYYMLSLSLIHKSATDDVASEARARTQYHFNESASTVANILSEALGVKMKAGPKSARTRDLAASIVEGAYMARKSPESIYMAAIMLSEYEFAGLNGETRAAIKAYSRGIIDAWNVLHLKPVAPEALDAFEKRVFRDQNGRIRLDPLVSVIKGP